MQRFTGQKLREIPRIALTANDSLGNFAICTPLGQALKQFYPGCSIDFYGGERTAELERACVQISSSEKDQTGTIPAPLFAWRSSLHGCTFASAARKALARREEIGGYDLVINIESGATDRAFAALLGEGAFVCGPCLSPDSRTDWEFPADERGDLWRDKGWIADDLTERYSFLKTGFIGEIFIRLAYIDPIQDAPWPGGIPRYSLPSEKPNRFIPDVLISTGGTLPEKLWPLTKWRELLEWLRSMDVTVGLLGAPPKRQREFYHSVEDEGTLVADGLVEDLRGSFTLPKVVGAVTQSRLVVTIDNGILHFAAANDVPTVGLYRPGYDRLWAPPNPNLVRVLPKEGGVDRVQVDQVRQAAERCLETPAQSRT